MGPGPTIGPRGGGRALGQWAPAAEVKESRAEETQRRAFAAVALWTLPAAGDSVYNPKSLQQFQAAGRRGRGPGPDLLSPPPSR